MFETAFQLWGAPTTWAELLGTVLALAMVWCNVRVLHWGWPLAIASALVYGAVFWRSKLYAEAALQVCFVVVALWGWAQWLRGANSADPAVGIRRLTVAARWRCLALLAVAWPAIGIFLLHATDTDVPWWDAFPTAASVLGQILLGRKMIENWPVWLVVNVVSVGLFAWKDLWLTSGLYALFAVLSVLGWRSWQARLSSVAPRV